MAEIPGFIDLSLVCEIPRTRIVESALYALDRRLPRVLRDPLYAVLYGIPNFRTKKITTGKTTVEVLSRSTNEWYITGSPEDEGESGKSLVRLFEEQGERGIFMDIGASTGMYSMFALRNRLEVIAFEPDYQVSRILEQNARMNSAYPQQYFIQKSAITETEGLYTLYSDEFKEACPSLKKTGNQKGELSVKGYVLDGVSGGIAVPIPTIAKIDVEGGEKGVLEGGGKTFSHPRVSDLFVEIHPQFLPLFDATPEQVWRLVLDMGFEPKTVVPKGEEFFVHFKKPASN